MPAREILWMRAASSIGSGAGEKCPSRTLRRTSANCLLTALMLLPSATAAFSTDRTRSICSNSDSCFFVGPRIISFGVEPL